MWLTRLALRNPVLILMMSLMALALGAVSLDQSGGQAAHTLGFAGQYPVLHLHQRRQTARRQYPRFSTLVLFKRAVNDLSNVSWSMSTIFY